MRTAPKGSALWTPAGVCDPRPRDALHLYLACGRDGGFGLLSRLFIRYGPGRQKDGGQVGRLHPSNDFVWYFLILV